MVDNGYKCILSKQTLIYNLIYHINKCQTKDEINAEIKNILDKFEVKDDKNS